jgi:hypothetical protein
MKFSLFFGVLALFLGGFIIIVLPHDREVKSLGIFLFKLLPFIFAALSIALLDVDLVKRVKLIFPFLVMCFLVMFCIFIPRIFFYLEDFPKVYYLFLMLMPFIILTITLAYRLGGGTTGDTLRLAFILLCFMLSGIEDLAVLKVNHPTDPIPEVWEWASHIKVWIGHYPTKYEAYAFIAFHIGLAIFIGLYPFKSFRRFKNFFGVL